MTTSLSCITNDGLSRCSNHSASFVHGVLGGQGSDGIAGAASVIGGGLLEL
jgi:hypothetical protein